MTRYEVTPIRIVLPAVPTLEAKPHPLSEVRDEQVIHITGATTFSTTLSAAQREENRRRTPSKPQMLAVAKSSGAAPKPSLR